MGESYLADVPGNHTHTAYLDPVLAGDATEEQVIFTAPFRARIMAVSITADAAVTGDATNRKNLNVINKGAAGAGSAEIGNLDLLAAENLVAADEKDFAGATNGALTETEILAGDVLALEIEQAGAGVAIPKSIVKVTYQASGAGI